MEKTLYLSSWRCAFSWWIVKTEEKKVEGNWSSKTVELGFSTGILWVLILGGVGLKNEKIVARDSSDFLGKLLHYTEVIGTHVKYLNNYNLFDGSETPAS